MGSRPLPDKRGCTKRFTVLDRNQPKRQAVRTRAFAQIRSRIAAHAGLGDHVVCKLSGLVTEAGFKQLRAYLSEVPAERFKTPTKVKDIPRLFTVETFCKLVVLAQRQAQAAA